MLDQKINIAIIEDSPIHADWLKTVLAKDPGVHLAHCSSLGWTGIEAAKRLAPQLLFLDFQLRDITGVEVARRIKSSDKNVKIFMITAHSEVSIIERLINDKNMDAIGIKGSPYLENNLLSAMRHVLAGGNYIDSSLLSQLRESHKQSCLSLLTKREFEIFIQLSMGKSEMEVANSLFIDLGHVHNMKSKISKKLKDVEIGPLITRLIENINRV